MPIDSEIVSIYRQAGGWVWAILDEDPETRINRVICQAKMAVATYEAAYDAAQGALNEWRSRPRAAPGN
jgi:hypothetical protein